MSSASAHIPRQVINLTNIGGHAVSVLGIPRDFSTPHGDTIQFHGITWTHPAVTFDGTNCCNSSVDEHSNQPPNAHPATGRRGQRQLT